MLAMVIFITGCATSYEYESGDTTFHVKSFREFKRIEVEYGDLHIVASGVTDDTAEALIGVTNTLSNTAAATGTAWLMGGPLVDMTGQSRGATAAEMAAQFKALEERENARTNR